GNLPGQVHRSRREDGWQVTLRDPRNEKKGGPMAALFFRLLAGDQSNSAFQCVRIHAATWLTSRSYFPLHATQISAVNTANSSIENNRCPALANCNLLPDGLSFFMRARP